MDAPLENKCTIKTFRQYVLPSVVAMLLFSLYTVVDGIFVAWGAGELALASVTLSLPFISTLSGIAVLFSMGAATLVAFARGRGDMEEANNLFRQSVGAMGIIAVTITVLMVFFSDELAVKLGAGPLTMADTSSYLHIVSLFSICFILSYCFEIMVKVDGSPHLAMVGVGSSFITNIVLDYILVIHLNWGVVGAAWATGIAQLVSFIIFLSHFLGKKSNLKLGRFRWDVKKLLKGLPLGVADFSVELIIAFLTLLYNRIMMELFGENSLSIYSVIAYLNLFVFMMMQGVSQGMMHLVSLHLGHGEEKTARGYFRMSILTVLMVGVLCFAVAQLAPERIAGLLLDGESELMGATIIAIREYSYSFLLVGLNIAVAGYFTARELAVPSMSLALSRGFIFAPVALLFCAYVSGGIFFWYGAIFGEVLTLIATALVYRNFLRKEKKKRVISS